MTMPLVIQRLYGFIAANEEGEGIAGARMGDTWMPLVGADAARMASLLPVARNAAIVSGVPLRFVRFSERTQLGILEPHATIAALAELDAIIRREP